MNATTVSYIIAYAGLYSVFLSLPVAIYRFPYLRGPVLVFGGLELIGACIVLLSTLVLKNDNNYLSFIDAGSFALGISLMYAPLMPAPWLKRAVGWFGSIAAVGVVVNYFFWEGRQQEGATIATGLMYLMVALIVLVYLNWAFKNTQITSLRRHPMWLISIGLLTVSLVIAPIYLFIKPLMSYSMTLATRAYDFMFTVSFMSHVLYALAFWSTKHSTSAATPQAT